MKVVWKVCVALTLLLSISANDINYPQLASVRNATTSENLDLIYTAIYNSSYLLDYLNEVNNFTGSENQLSCVRNHNAINAKIYATNGYQIRQCYFVSNANLKNYFKTNNAVEFHQNYLLDMLNCSAKRYANQAMNCYAYMNTNWLINMSTSSLVPYTQNQYNVLFQLQSFADTITVKTNQTMNCFNLN